MASTIKISDTLNWCQCYAGFRGLNIGANNEPAITSANLIIQSMAAPPFSWNWNRDMSIQFLTIVGQQDYSVSAPSFGFIEKAGFIPAATITATSLTGNVATYIAANSFSPGNFATVTGTTNGSGIFNVVYQPILAANSTQFTIALTHANVSSASDSGIAIGGSKFETSQVMNVLGQGTELGSPANIAPQIDNNAGLITFRLLPIPEQVYQLTLIQQKRIPALVTAVSNTWAPVPDHYNYIVCWGYLALLMAYQDDPRWQIYNQKFVASLLGVAEGLSEEQKNIFQAAWLNTVTEQTGATMRLQQGIMGRGNQ